MLTPVRCFPPTSPHEPLSWEDRGLLDSGLDASEGCAQSVLPRSLSPDLPDPTAHIGAESGVRGGVSCVYHSQVTPALNESGHHYSPSDSGVGSPPSSAGIAGAWTIKTPLRSTGVPALASDFVFDNFQTFSLPRENLQHAFTYSPIPASSQSLENVAALPSPLPTSVPTHCLSLTPLSSLSSSAQLGEPYGSFRVSPPNLCFRRRWLSSLRRLIKPPVTSTV